MLKGSLKDVGVPFILNEENRRTVFTRARVRAFRLKGGVPSEARLLLFVVHGGFLPPSYIHRCYINQPGFHGMS